jgi:hypothetical protein
VFFIHLFDLTLAIKLSAVSRTPRLIYFRDFPQWIVAKCVDRHSGEAEFEHHAPEASGFRAAVGSKVHWKQGVWRSSLPLPKVKEFGGDTKFLREWRRW